MPNASLKAIVCVGAILIAGCSTPTHYWFSEGRLRRTELDRVLRENPVPAGQAIQVIDLGSSSAVSHHIVQVSTAEALHIHRDHDLSVFVYRGHGVMRVGQERFKLREGDSLFIPRGVSHAFENRSTNPTVAVVIFTPAFDGKDTIPVEK